MMLDSFPVPPPIPYVALRIHERRFEGEAPTERVIIPPWSALADSAKAILSVPLPCADCGMDDLVLEVRRGFRLCTYCLELRELRRRFGGPELLLPDPGRRERQ